MHRILDGSGTQTAALLSTILKANTEPAVAVYLSLQNARAKRDAMDAAAKVSLSEDDFLLFQALMDYKSATEKQRTDLAHGIFGICVKVKAGIIWVDTTTYSQNRIVSDLNGFTSDNHDKFLKKCFVYEVGDLETIAREIENLYNQIGMFNGYLKIDDPTFRARRYPELCAEPRIQKEIDRLLQKNAQAAKADRFGQTTDRNHQSV